jgi:hypothetical protein
VPAAKYQSEDLKKKTQFSDFFTTLDFNFLLMKMIKAHRAANTK